MRNNNNDNFFLRNNKKQIIIIIIIIFLGNIYRTVSTIISYESRDDSILEVCLPSPPTNVPLYLRSLSRSRVLTLSTYQSCLQIQRCVCRWERYVFFFLITDFSKKCRTVPKTNVDESKGNQNLEVCLPLLPTNAPLHLKSLSRSRLFTLTVS